MDIRRQVLNSLTVPLLKRLCKHQGYPQEQKKQDLVESLAHLSCQELDHLINRVIPDAAAGTKVQPLLKQLAFGSVSELQAASEEECAEEARSGFTADADLVLESQTDEAVTQNDTNSVDTESRQEEVHVPLRHSCIEAYKTADVAEKQQPHKVCLTFTDPRNAKKVGQYLLTAMCEKTQQSVFELQVGPSTRCTFEDVPSDRIFTCRLCEHEIRFDYTLSFASSNELAAFERDLQVRRRVMTLASKVAQLKRSVATQGEPRSPSIGRQVAVGALIIVPVLIAVIVGVFGKQLL